MIHAIMRSFVFFQLALRVMFFLELFSFPK
jgi:hypothetical protein